MLHPTTGQLKLLLLDDHTHARAALERRLATRPGVAVVASTEHLPEALEAVDAAEPHAALVDIRRADRGGFDAVRALAALPDLRRPLIAIHTAFLDGEEWLQARQAGAHVSIVKQVSVDALLERLAEAIRRELPAARWPGGA